jgi:hypothetical protein
MSTNNEIIEAILQKFINELKKQESLSYAGNTNLWVDLGWDISQGDGEICHHVEDLLRLIIDSLPEDVKELIWSESWVGKVRMKEILEEIKKTNGDLSTIPRPEAHEVIEDIIEYLKDSLFIKAEAAYDQYQETDSEEEYEDDDAEEEYEDDE